MKNVLQKHKEQLKALVTEKGYWSEEVEQFIKQWNCYTKQNQLHNLARMYEKSN